MGAWRNIQSAPQEDQAYRDNPTPEEAEEYERLSRDASRAWDRAVAAEEGATTLRRKMEEASMKTWMIQHQADQTGQAVAKHMRAQLWWIKVLLLVLVLVMAYATHQLPRSLSP
jgi:hypothetical protein